MDDFDNNAMAEAHNHGVSYWHRRRRGTIEFTPDGWFVYWDTHKYFSDAVNNDARRTALYNRWLLTHKPIETNIEDYP